MSVELREWEKQTQDMQQPEQKPIPDKEGKPEEGALKPDG